MKAIAGYVVKKMTSSHPGFLKAERHFFERAARKLKPSVFTRGDLQ
jgi:hypothetical protein